MAVVFWIFVILTTVIFLGAGGTKLAQKREQLKKMHMEWVEDFSGRSVKLIGSIEILGALGVLLPAVTKVAPNLTPIAAVCLALLMLGAVGTHIKRKEAPYLPLILATIAGLTATFAGIYLS